MPNSGAVSVSDGGILAVSVGGAGQWTTGTSGNGPIGGLLSGQGGQAGGTVSYAGNVGLGLNVTGTQTYSGNINNVGTSLGLYVGNKDGGTASDPFTQTGTLILSGNNAYTGSTNVGRTPPYACLPRLRPRRPRRSTSRTAPPCNSAATPPPPSSTEIRSR